MATGDAGNKETGDNPTLPKLELIFRAFWRSLGLVLLSALVGLITGVILGHQLGHASRAVVVSLQAAGAMFLLWGTLFVRGWEIQTLGGVTVPERINRWLYRALYCVGTAAIVCSLGLPSSAGDETSPAPVGASHTLRPYLTSFNAWIPVVGTLLGVVAGALIGRWLRQRERKDELRSVLQALLWEMEDAKPRLSLPTAILLAPTPSFETLLSRGLLSLLPHAVAARVLAARSMLQLHQRDLEDFMAHAPGYEPQKRKEDAKTLTGIAQAALPVLEVAIEAVRNYLGKHAVSRNFPINVPGEPGTAAP